jgi:hypothetical protein
MAIPNSTSGYDLAVGKEGFWEKLVHALVGNCRGSVDLIDHRNQLHLQLQEN